MCTSTAATDGRQIGDTFLGHDLSKITRAEVRNNRGKVVFFSQEGAEFKLLSGKDQDWKMVEEAEGGEETEGAEKVWKGKIILKTPRGTYEFPGTSSR